MLFKKIVSIHGDSFKTKQNLGKPSQAILTLELVQLRMSKNRPKRRNVSFIGTVISH